MICIGRPCELVITATAAVMAKADSAVRVTMTAAAATYPHPGLSERLRVLNYGFQKIPKIKKGKIWKFLEMVKERTIRKTLKPA